MDKKKLLLLLGAMTVAIGTALAARSMFAGASAPPAEAVQPVPMGPKVLVAQRALPVGTIITADSISFQPWPKELVQQAYYIEGEADVAKLVGTVVRYPITAGQPLTQGVLVAPGDRGFLAAALGPGMRAITIPVSAKTGVAGFVFPGDHVDLVLTQSVRGNGGGDGQTLKAAETILRNLRVLATDQSTENETTPEGKTVVRVVDTVTLEVTPRIAEKISVAQTIGTLSLSLRSIADNQAELERAIASGAIKVPEGVSKEEEERFLSQAMNRPIEGSTTYVTGGDVSRFQRTSVPPSSEQAARRFASAMGSGLSAMFGSAMSAGAPPQGAGGMAAAPRAPQGPVVRVTRGKATTEVEVGRN